MNEKFSKIRAEWEKRRSIPKAIVGMRGNFNTVAVKRTLRHIVIQEHFLTRIFIGLSLALFGPGLMYMYITKPEGWSKDMPLYVEGVLIFSIAIGTIFSIKHLFLPSKIKVDQINGEIEIKKNPLHATRKIDSHEINDLSWMQSTYTHKGQSTDLYTLVVELKTGEKLGLFITTKKEIINEFIAVYPNQSIVQAA